MLEHWLFTITFKPNYRAVQKYKLIEKLPKMLSKFIDSKRIKNAYLFYTVEYHKLKYGPMAGDNDVTAPHIHGILEIDGHLSNAVSELIQRELSTVYGRTQFFIKEVLTEVEGWKEYCLKDVQINNDRYQFQHLREVVLEKVKNNVFEDDVDLLEEYGM